MRYIFSIIFILISTISYALVNEFPTVEIESPIVKELKEKHKGRSWRLDCKSTFIFIEREEDILVVLDMGTCEKEFQKLKDKIEKQMKDEEV